MITLPVDSIDLSNYSIDELTTLKSRVDALLPSENTRLDLNQELIRQFRTLSNLLNNAITGDEAQLNHIASLQSACTTLMRQIAETQSKLYTASTIQAMEQALKEALEDLPTTSKEHFLNLYEEKLSRIAAS